MLRISPVPFEDMNEDMRAIVRTSDAIAGGSEWVQAYAHAPDIFVPFVRFYYEYLMTDRGGISLKLTELMRHVVAEKNQCQLCIRLVYPSAREQGLTDEMLAALPQYQDSPLFTPREKAALHFAEMMAGDHKQISQDLFDELRQHFSEPEILALGWRIAIFVGWGRLSAALGLDDIGKVCPLADPGAAGAVGQKLTANQDAAGHV
jgi:alkylhydroperoxidase family enzyme